MGVSYVRRNLQELSDEKQKRYAEYHHRHILYMDREGKLYLAGRYSDDILSYFIEMTIDNWDYDIRYNADVDNVFTEIRQMIEEQYINKAMYLFSGAGLDHWALSNHICNLGEVRSSDLNMFKLKVIIDAFREKTRFYTNFINWDRVNQVMDEVDAEKPQRMGWGIWYPERLYDELKELYDKDCILLSENKYVEETYVRLQKHMQEEKKYYYLSMR